MASYSEKELYKKIMNSPAFYKARYRDAIRCGYYAIDEDLRRGTRQLYKTFFFFECVNHF